MTGTAFSSLEFSNESLNVLANTLMQTLNPATQKDAEQSLQSMQKTARFSLMLLTLIETCSDVHVKMTASVLFKNHIKKFWSSGSLSAEEMLQIKDKLVPLMLSNPSNVQSQLSEIVSIISATDFPHEWDSLLPVTVFKC